MKKTLLTLLITISGAALFAQACVPNPAEKSTDGNWPAALNTAWLDSNYRMVITNVVPLDTNVTVSGIPVTATIDSVDIINVSGLPAGYSYACGKPNCHFYGGTRSCTVITGTTSNPALVGTHPLEIFTESYVTAFSIAQSPRFDTVKTYSLVIQKATTTGMTTFATSEAGSMVLYPNPTSGLFTVRASLNETNLVTIRVFTSLGQLVSSENMKRSDGKNLILSIPSGKIL